MISNRQVQLGTFDNKVHAAKAYDIMALVVRGLQASGYTNYPASIYHELMPLADALSKVSQVRNVHVWQTAFVCVSGHFTYVVELHTGQYTNPPKQLWNVQHTAWSATGAGRQLGQNSF